MLKDKKHRFILVLWRHYWNVDGWSGRF